MSDLLTAIVEQKRSELPGISVRDDLSLSKRSFVHSLRSARPALIAEVKPKSPSEGELMEELCRPSAGSTSLTTGRLGMSQLENLLTIYNNHAQAISVLCDQKFFGGGYDLLAAVREMTDLPILAKEFIIDPLQISKAREAGADAVLLIASILTEKEIQHFTDIAIALGMSVLLEIHHGTELVKIPNRSSDNLVIGINNRDLQSLSIDLELTPALSVNIRDALPEHLIISESGIQTREQVERLSDDCDGFLIGTTFLKADDVEEKIQLLFP